MSRPFTPTRRAVLRSTAAAGTAAAVAACVANPPPANPPAPPPEGPLTSADLIGKTLRVYHTGDALTRDFRQDRANIELGPDERIVSVWIG